MQAVEIHQLSKSFHKRTTVLKNINLSVGNGEMVALIGASGSGKSTLLRHIAGLVIADAGTPSSVTVAGRIIQAAGHVSADAASIRCSIGVIFQQFNLVPRLRVITNVLIGNLGKMNYWRGVLGLFSRQDKERAMRALQRVGIADKALQRGVELSGGQQQRAAIARALVQEASLIIADEPIASLDPSSARRVMDTLRDLNNHDGTTVLVSLHQVEYALSYCPRTIALRDGEVVYDGPSSNLTTDFLGELYGEESEDLMIHGALDRGSEISADCESTVPVNGYAKPGGLSAKQIGGEQPAVIS